MQHHPADVLFERANWRQTFYNTYHVDTGAAVMKFYVSLCVKAIHRKYVQWFYKHKIKPKYV